MKNLLHAGFAALLIFPPLVAALPQQEEKLFLLDADLKKMAKSTGKYFQARDKEEKVYETINDFFKEYEKLQKAKYPGKKNKEEEDALNNALLKHTKDWTEILDAAGEFSGRYKKMGLIPGNSKDFTVKEEGEEFSFLLSLPKSYTEKSAWPLVVGITNSERKSARDFFKEEWAEPSLLENFIVLIPQMPKEKNKWAADDGLFAFFLPLSHILNTLHVDSDRIFLIGDQEGAKTTAILGSRFPHRFAGVVFRGDSWEAVQPKNFNYLSSYVLTPEKEEQEEEKKSSSQKFTEALKKLSYENCTVGEGKMAQVAEWMKERKRISYPQEVVFYPPNYGSLNSGSLQLGQLMRFEDMPKDTEVFIKAVFDRATNSVEVESAGVESYWINLNDQILDLDKPVVITHNRQKVLETRVIRNPKFFIERSYERYDNRLVYVGQIYVLVPSEIRLGIPQPTGGTSESD